MTDVFISYSRNDREKVRLIAEALEREGFDVWWDPEIPPGESFSKVIDRQLKESKCIIAVWSESSIHSNWVQEEADDGMMRNTLVPVMIDEIDLPRGFKRLQTADLRGWAGDTRDPNWQLIISQVRKLVSAKAADMAAERQAETRQRAQTRPPAAAAASPRKSSGGGFPVLPLLILLLLLGGGAAYWFLMGPGASDKPTLAAVESDGETAAEAEEAAVDAGPEEPLASTEAEDETQPETPEEVAEEPAAEVAQPAEEAAVEDDEPQLAAAAPVTPGKTFRDCDDCPEMIVIAGGGFTMGAAPGEYGHEKTETPQLDVTISRPFALGVYEVTYDEWRACLADGGCNGYEPPAMGWGEGRRPVVNISYNDAAAFVDWLSGKTGAAYRLPSEAEWEYAARAGTTDPFIFGDLISTNEANFNGQYPYKDAEKQPFRGKTLEVGAFKANGFGLYDTHGNVWEWTADCWRPSHSGAPADGSAVGGACSSHVLKGGAWNAGAWRLRSGHRKPTADTVRDFDTGLRVARDL